MRLRVHLFLSFVLLLSLFLNNNCLAKDNSPEEIFWNWVSKNEDFIYNIDETNQEQLLKIKEQISKVNESIGFLVEERNVNEKRVLVLTTFGKQESIQFVDKLYVQKPKLEKLDIIKYIPRGRLVQPLQIIGKYIEAEDIGAWLMKQKNGKAKIIFGSSKIDMTYAEEYLNDIYIYVLKEIGEYDLVTKIDSVDIQPVNFMSPEVVPLSKFQEGFDKIIK